MVVGKIGDNLRMDYTAVGDTTNLAARLQQLAEPGTILVSEAIRRQVGEQIRLESLPPVQVKGKTEPVEIFTLVGARNENVDPEFLKWLQTYEEAVAKFRKRDFKEAKILFSHFLEFYPDDPLGKMYLAIALEYENAPPDEAWNAVEVFKKK